MPILKFRNLDGLLLTSLFTDKRAILAPYPLYRARHAQKSRVDVTTGCRQIGKSIPVAISGVICRNTTQDHSWPEYLAVYCGKHVVFVPMYIPFLRLRISDVSHQYHDTCPSLWPVDLHDQQFSQARFTSASNTTSRYRFSQPMSINLTSPLIDFGGGGAVSDVVNDWLRSMDACPNPYSSCPRKMTPLPPSPLARVSTRNV